MAEAAVAPPPVRTPNRRKALSLETKVDIIRDVESSNRQRNKIAKEYGISHSTLSTIYKNKDRILEQYKRHNVTLKRVRTSSIGEVEEAVLRWYHDACSKNISVSGPMVKNKAKELAQVVGNNTFKASNGWLERFKLRHRIHFKSGGKEKANIGMAVVRDWQQHELPTILQQYAPRDIFVAGESGFLYHLTLDDLVKQKSATNPIIQKNKDRLTGLFCCNMDGSEKEKLLLIGRFPNPRSFKGVKSLPVTYASDKRALMNAVLFEKWFLRFDEKMKWQQRKVLLFIDNCPAHRFNVYLQATEVRFLPPNTTMYHPLSQGIKQVSKCYYRRRIVQRALAEQNPDKMKPITVRDAADMLAWAWESVSPATVMSCFRKSGFMHPAMGEIPINLDEYTHQVQALNVLIAAFLQRRRILHKISALEYIDVDEFLPVCEDTWNQGSPVMSAWPGQQPQASQGGLALPQPLPNQAPLPHPNQPPNNQDQGQAPQQPPLNQSEEEDDDEQLGQPAPKPKEVLNMLQSVRSFFQSQENIPGQVFAALANLEESVLYKMTENVLKTPGLEFMHF
uniref:HTH CENPB-type domain-containing protein n=1 Tax=Strigamia maritima TaxID=126957 RepID=T1JIF1_STRMM